MPNVLQVKGYRFFFFSLEGNEPPRIHVEAAERFAKFWLNPVSLAKSRGFRSDELSEIQSRTYAKSGRGTTDYTNHTDVFS